MFPACGFHSTPHQNAWLEEEDGKSDVRGVVTPWSRMVMMQVSGMLGCEQSRELPTRHMHNAFASLLNVPSSSSSLKSKPDGFMLGISPSWAQPKLHGHAHSSSFSRIIIIINSHKKDLSDRIQHLKRNYNPKQFSFFFSLAHEE